MTVIVASVTGAAIGVISQSQPATKVKMSAFSKDAKRVIAASGISGKATIIDGDSLTIKGTSIRLHGIDAPEFNQPCWNNDVKYNCGHTATAYLQRLINGQTVTCTILDQDAYGREIAKCFTNKNININAQMVLSGNAIAYLYFSYDYEQEQAEAKAHKRGLWAGRFMEPYKFRKG